MTTIEVTTYIERNDDEIEVFVEASWSPGSPAVPYLRNGDPGYPEEPDEVEFLSVTDSDGNEYELTEDEKEKLYEEIVEKAIAQNEPPED